MAFNKMLPRRVFRLSRFTNAVVTTWRVSSSCVVSLSKTMNHSVAPNPSDDCIHRYIHFRSAALASPELRFLPTGEKLLEKFQEMDMARQRIRLDFLVPEANEEKEAAEGTITVKDAVKILKLSHLETVKFRLSQIEKDFVSYPEFLEICARDCLNADQSLEFAKILDQFGSVIVLGNVVFFRPEQEIETMFRNIFIRSNFTKRNI